MQGTPDDRPPCRVCVRTSASAGHEHSLTPRTPTQRAAGARREAAAKGRWSWRGKTPLAPFGGVNAPVQKFRTWAWLDRLRGFEVEMGSILRDGNGLSLVEIDVSVDPRSNCEGRRLERDAGSAIDHRARADRSSPGSVDRGLGSPSIHTPRRQIRTGSIEAWVQGVGSAVQGAAAAALFMRWTPASPEALVHPNGTRRYPRTGRIYARGLGTINPLHRAPRAPKIDTGPPVRPTRRPQPGRSQGGALGSGTLWPIGGPFDGMWIGPAGSHLHMYAHTHRPIHPQTRASEQPGGDGRVAPAAATTRSFNSSPEEGGKMDGSRMARRL